MEETAAKRKSKKDKAKQRKKQQEEELRLFLEDCEKKHISTESLKVVNFTETGRGLAAQKTLVPGDEIIGIDFDNLISLQTVFQHPKISVVLVELGEKQVRKDDLFALYLMLALADETNPFHRYVKVFPKRYTNPLYFSEAQMTHLKGSNLFLIAVQLRQQTMQDYEDFFQNQLFKMTNVFPPQLQSHLSYQQYVWALSSIWSRAIDVEFNNEWIRLLVPYVDLLNHSFDVGTHHSLDVKTKRFVVKANDTFHPTQQVYLNYGPIPNTKLVQVYGFAVENNPHDAIDIFAPMNQSDPLYSEKSKFLQQNNININHFFLRKGQIDATLLQVLRVQEIDDTELSLMGVVTSNSIVTEKNERRVLNRLIDACQQMFSAYETTIEQDEALLKTGLDIEVKHCVILRKSEKEILQGCLQWLKQKISQLD